jgi:hypothetical protein
LIIQVDTLCHKIPNFIEKARRAGVTRVFIGLENINPANLLAAKKRQNKITEYRKMLLAWKHAGVITYAGYILGFPADTPQSISEDIEILKRELPLDILEFFCLTPLPGSEDHKTLWNKGVWMDPDMNKYDLEHVTTGHPKMSPEEWGRGLSRGLGGLLHTRAQDDDHAPRRGGRHGHVTAARGAVRVLGRVPVEKLHPLQFGAFRLKYRLIGAQAFRSSPYGRFYPKYWWEIVTKHVRLAKQWIEMSRMCARARREQKVSPYTDLAMTPVTDEETETLEMFTHNAGARDQVAHVRKVDALTHGKQAAVGRKPSARDDNRGADAHAAIEIKHILIVHTEAAV